MPLAFARFPGSRRFHRRAMEPRRPTRGYLTASSGASILAAMALDRPRTSRRFHALARWLLAAFALTQLGALAHLALVPHGVCAQHGELVHDAAHAHAHEPASTSTAEPRWSAFAEREVHADHCGLPWLVRSLPHAWIGDPAEGLRRGERVQLGLAHFQPPRAASVPLYLLAPKTSPPRLGL
jgi:hypothetical protein